MFNRVLLKNLISISVDLFMLMFAVSLLIIGTLYLVGVWNTQWSTGYLLRPAADDWNDVTVFAHYLTGKPYFKDLFFIRYTGHPQPLMLLIDFFVYQLGLYSYQYVIVYHIFLQSIIVLIYAYWTLKYSSLPLVLKVYLLGVPLLLMFDPWWWAFFHVIQGYTWAYGYVCAYIAFSMLIFADTTENTWRFLILGVLFACLSGHFFAAGFMIWPVYLFMMRLGSRWHVRHYSFVILFAIVSVYIYTRMQSPSYYTANDRLTMILHHPVLFTRYLILLFANNTITTYTPSIAFINYIIGSVTLFLSLYFTINFIIYKPKSLLEKFSLGLLTFSFLILLGVAYGRFDDHIETWPFHYEPCVLALYAPLIILITIQGYDYLGKLNYVIIASVLVLFLYYSPSCHLVINNNQILRTPFFPPSKAPDYERISLMLFSIIDLPSFLNIQSRPVKELPYVNVLAKYHYGFANHPDLGLRGKRINRDISTELTYCSGEIMSHEQYDFNGWDLLELQGWAWDNVTNNIPKLILITDGNNEIINTASAEMTHVLKQTTTKSTWLTYIPHEKIQSKHIDMIKMWALTKNNTACFIKSYSIGLLNKNTARLEVGAAVQYANTNILPKKTL